MKKRTSGFTLIELSIVLVIIGLIVGGVLVGRDLISVAGLRSDISAIEKLDTAVNVFKSKYNCLPGDCANATDFFTDAINGNGDGSIDGFSYDCGGPPGRWCVYQFLSSSEVTYAMDELARAGLTHAQPIDTSNSGTINSDVWAYKPFVKTSRGSYILIMTLPALDKSFYRIWNNGNAGPYFVQGTNLANYSPLQISQIDKKIDDGYARTGRVIGGQGFNYLTTDGGWDGWDPDIFVCVGGGTVAIDTGVPPYPYAKNDDASAQCAFGVQASF